jgi:hypothetical protein
MAFCPECRLEYPPAIVMCPKCGGELSEGSLEAAESGPEGVVSLAPVSGLVEGYMLVGALESQGLHPRLIHHELPAHGAVLRDWGTTDWGDIRVPVSEAEEARMVLEDFREALARMSPLEEADPATGGTTRPERQSQAGSGHLQAVPPADASGSAAAEIPGGAGDPVELVPLCPVQDLAEGKMLEGALKSQGLHPVLAEESPDVLPGQLEGRPYGEIRMPPRELLEARAVLEDFRRAVERSRREKPSLDE